MSPENQGVFQLLGMVTCDSRASSRKTDTYLSQAAIAYLLIYNILRLRSSQPENVKPMLLRMAALGRGTTLGFGAKGDGKGLESPSKIIQLTSLKVVVPARPRPSAAKLNIEKGAPIIS